MNYTDYLNNRKDYQEEGVEFLLTMKHCCLYYKPGKGKTYPCIEAIRDIDRSMNGKARVLVLSTADAIRNMWQAEIVPQNIMPKSTKYVTTSAAVRHDTMIQLTSYKYDILVVDECHKIKSHNSQISKLVYILSKYTEYVFGLSGTPRGNNDVDIFCQFHNMNIGPWGNIAYTRFVQEYCDIDVKFFNGRQINQPTGIKDKYKTMWERNIAMYTRRADYDKNDNMPDLIINTEIVPYEQSKTYKDAERGIIQLDDYETTLLKLTAIAKAQQIANGFLYIQNDVTEERKIVDVDNRKYIKAKQMFNYIHDKLRGKHCVIVYKFQYDLAIIHEVAKQLGYMVTESLNDFIHNRAPILILQCQHCESINLQIADAILFYTMDYSYINYDQMIHRAWRMGRVDPVYVTVFIVQGTVERKIWDTVQNKGTLANLFYSIKETYDG